MESALRLIAPSSESKYSELKTEKQKPSNENKRNAKANAKE